MTGDDMTGTDWHLLAIGAGWFILAFVMGCALLALFKRLYQLSTPYDEAKLVAEGNVAAATALGGAIVGFALPLASAIANTASAVEFVVWAVIAGIIQIVASLFVRRVVIRDLSQRIVDGNVATAIYLAATSVAIGMINAVSMSY
jgi:putative membrane protein